MNTPKTRRPNRGQATVEMAVVMVALIPTFLYVLTADDLLRYRLNLQEVVVASPWNYTHLNYENHSIPAGLLVPHLQRRYENINNTYSMNYSDTPTENKTAPMTFASWGVDNTDNKNRVNCDVLPDFAANYGAEPLAVFVRPGEKQVNHGGRYYCSAKLSVRNMMLVNRFMQSWAGNVKVTDKVKGIQAWGLSPQWFSVMADTWAMTTVNNVEPELESHKRAQVPLWARVQTVYENTPSLGAAVNAARAFVEGAPDVFNTDILKDKNHQGDDTATAEVGFSTTPFPRTQINPPFDSSPWLTEGARGGPYYKTWLGRKSTYMGLPSSEW